MIFYQSIKTKQWHFGIDYTLIFEKNLFNSPVIFVGLIDVIIICELEYQNDLDHVYLSYFVNKLFICLDIVYTYHPYKTW